MSQDAVPTPGHPDEVVFLRREVLAAGYTDPALRRQLACGEWSRIRHGAFAVTSVWTALTAHERHHHLARAVMRQARASVVASHTTAAIVLGVPDWGIDLATVHLTRRDGRAGRAEAGVRQHRGKLIEGDVVTHAGVETTSGTRTAIDVTTVLDIEPALGVVCSLLHEGHTTTEAIDSRYQQMQTNPFTMRSRIVLSLASPHIESIGEARTLHLLWRNGIPMPELQHAITGDDGRELARADFAWPEHRVYLEFDGKMKYDALLRPGETAADVLLRERRRESLIHERTGWRCIRLTWADLQSPARTVARIRAVLGLRDRAA